MPPAVMVPASGSQVSMLLISMSLMLLMSMSLISMECSRSPSTPPERPPC